MEELKMLTREDVANTLHVHVNTVSMLREVGIINGIKIGKNYMFPQKVIRAFQEDYIGLDVSNREKAILSRETVENRKKCEETISQYRNKILAGVTL